RRSWLCDPGKGHWFHNQHPGRNADTHRYADRYCYTNTHADGQSEPVSDINAIADGDAASYGHSFTDVDTDCDAASYGDSFTDVDTNRYANANRIINSRPDSYAGIIGEYFDACARAGGGQRPDRRNDRDWDGEQEGHYPGDWSDVE